MDLSCTAFTGLVGYEVLDLAVYDGPDGYGILAKYPTPQIALYGHVMTFSLNVSMIYVDNKSSYFGIYHLYEIIYYVYIYLYRKNYLITNHYLIILI